MNIHTCERVCGGRTRGNTNCGLIRTEYHRNKKKRELTYSNLLRYEIFNIKSIVIQRETKVSVTPREPSPRTRELRDQFEPRTFRIVNRNQYKSHTRAIILYVCYPTESLTHTNRLN